MDKLRMGIVGMGNAGTMHARAFLDGSVPDAVLTAACDAKAKREQLRKTLPEDVRLFDDFDAMISSGTCDAVVVATPHPQHPELSAKALKAGLHVFCEKPAGVSAGDVRKLNETAATAGRVFCMHFNKRLEPAFQRLRSLIADGELGELRRINWISTGWFRSECYYSTARWRGTWEGEGGGLLINQCIHDLDTWQYLFGMPDRTRSFCRFGKSHRIEVEDEATAFFEYKSGLTGTFIASSGEAPGTNRIEIACDRGKVVVENKTIKFHRTSVPVSEFSACDERGFGEPDCWVCEIPAAGKADLSSGMMRNFVSAVLRGTPLLVKGEEGLASLEMENAILLSTWIDDWAELPVDAARFEAELAKRVASSKGKVLSGPDRVLNLHESFK